jgi:hypothetical protein
VDENGRWLLPGPEPRLWFPIAGFLLFQGVLILALIRMREPEQSQPSVFQTGKIGL